ncbi:MAG: histidine kinase [Actinomycetota bacterium]|nr:histidine kinase [Actinomycetota bacterium]
MADRTGGLAPGAPAYVHIGVLLLGTLLAAHERVLGAAAPWLLALAALAALTSRSRRTPRAADVALLATELLLVGAAVTFTGGGRSPLLPFLLAPMFSAGYRYGNRGTVVAAMGGGASVAAWRVAGSALDQPQGEPVLLAQWVLLGLGAGLLAAWTSRVQALEPVDADDGDYQRARELLTELSRVAHKLPGALDPASAADAVLEEAAQIAPYDHAAVVTRYGGEHIVPVAIRGLQRVPWRGPLTEEGPLWQAWHERRTVIDVRRSDGPDGRRRDSTLVVVPLAASDGEEPLGLVALESRRPEAYSPEVVHALEDLLERRTTRLEIALLFGDLRHSATLEERERLAREMHDGVAQNLAYFGFELDSLKNRVTKTAPEHAEAVADLRRKLTHMIQDIRLSITDLRSTVTPERGLGAVLSSYVRLAANARGLTVHLSLRESGFRLAAEHEMFLFRVAQRFASVATRAEGAQNLWVSLETDPPHGFLVMEHDGGSAAPNDGDHPKLEDLRASAEALGWEFVTSRSATGARRLEVRRSGGDLCPPDSSSLTTTPSSARA